MEELIRTLIEGKHSLVVANGDVKTFDGRGVSDLFGLITSNPAFLAGARVADKVVGKGAAALMILGQVDAVHALVMSRPALELLKGSTVTVSYDRLVDNIINRRGDGLCPVETLCLPYMTPAECLPPIASFLSKSL